MRATIAALLLFAAAGSVGKASADELRIPDEHLAFAQRPSAETNTVPWHNEGPDPSQLRERPMGEVLAARLGLVEGKAELFRYQMGTGSSRATLAGLADGGGIKLRLRW